jgi:uncharacterized lipoprotein
VKKLVVLSVFLLSGCSLLNTNASENKVLNSRNGPGLVVPPPLTTDNISYFYSLPNEAQDAHVSIAPPVLD